MTPVVGSRRARLRHLVVATGAVLAGALVAVGVPSGAAFAQCDVGIGDDTVDLAVDGRDPWDPIVIRTDDTVEVVRPSDGRLGVVVWVGPAPVPMTSTGPQGRTSRVDVADFEWLGVGVYRVDVFGPGAGDCAGTVWVRVEGRSPLTTVAGAGSLVVLGGGAALVASSVRRGHRRRCSIVRGTVGGLFCGVGAGTLAQQFGLLPMLVPVLAVALIVPALLGGIIARRACVPVVVRFTLAPLLLAPLTVRLGEEFDVHVGVDQRDGTDRGRRHRRGARHEVVAQIVSAVAEPAAGHPWRQRLVAEPGGGVSEHVVRFRATRDIGEAHLTVLYSSGGQTVGIARRPLWVVGDGGALPPPNAADARTTGLPFGVPVGQPPVDLELRATFAGPRAHHVLEWTVETPHRDRIAVPDRPVAMDLGGDPDAFATDLLLDVTENEGRPGLDELLLGAGRQLARCFDPALLDVLRAVLDLVPLARVLILSEESSVPWELTAVEPTASAEPPFLATRAVVGRWFLDPGHVELPPPIGAPAPSRAVIATDVLPSAVVESRRLASELGFTSAPPTRTGVMDALERAGTVHLACHGSWRAEEGRFWLELSDGRLVPKHVAGLRLEHRPFVFLNACQVASGGHVLGTPTGFPAELVFAGASGCVSPLWSVRDDEACELAVAFYREVLAGRPPAEVIREQRWRAMTDSAQLSTPFAYQFVGHPALRLVEPAGAPAVHRAA